MTFEWWSPAKPFFLNQAWGIYNPAYQRFGFTKHNGVDVRPGEDGVLYAPFAGVIVRTGNQPDGGGIFLGMLSKQFYTFPDASCQVLVDMLHCKQLLVKEEDAIELGEPLALADNTGFSTGPHTHLQFRRVTWNAGNFQPIDSNEANNSFDPMPYWNNLCAQDYGYYTRLLNQLRKAVQALACRVAAYRSRALLPQKVENSSTSE